MGDLHRCSVGHADLAFRRDERRGDDDRLAVWSDFRLEQHVEQHMIGLGKERGGNLPQRSNVVQPRVARHELPWERNPMVPSTPTGLHQIVGRRMQPFQGWRI